MNTCIILATTNHLSPLPPHSMASYENHPIQVHVQDVPFRRSMSTKQWTTSPLAAQSAPRHHRKSKRPESSHQRLAAAREDGFREQALRSNVMRVGGEYIDISYWQLRCRRACQLCFCQTDDTMKATTMASCYKCLVPCLLFQELLGCCPISSFPREEHHLL